MGALEVEPDDDLVLVAEDVVDGDLDDLFGDLPAKDVATVNRVLAQLEERIQR